MMNNGDSTFPVVIVGGGPVGLFLGLCMEQHGISCRILERRSETSQDSRSLGIHPPSLDLLQALGVANAMIEDGIRIKHGHAFGNTSKLGSLNLAGHSSSFGFILSLPQSRTEEILQQNLNERNSDILIRNAEVTDFLEEQDAVRISYKLGGELKQIRAKYIIGCDGKNSLVRKSAQISFKGQKYPDTYVMGDFSDNTSFGDDAAIFLCKEGLIESFPLPKNRRRWVVKTDTYHSTNLKQIIEQQTSDRINHSLLEADNFMVSSFGVEKRIARPMVSNRTILCGDAAHVVSPIGGQGMNLGWLGAWDLAQSLSHMNSGSGKRTQQSLAAFEKRRNKAVQNSIRRSELNMRLGRKTGHSLLRNSLVSLMLRPPLSYLMSRLFSMHGIERWIT